MLASLPIVIKTDFTPILRWLKCDFLYVAYKYFKVTCVYWALRSFGRFKVHHKIVCLCCIIHLRVYILCKTVLIYKYASFFTLSRWQRKPESELRILTIIFWATSVSEPGSDFRALPSLTVHRSLFNYEALSSMNLFVYPTCSVPETGLIKIAVWSLTEYQTHHLLTSVPTELLHCGR